MSVRNLRALFAGAALAGLAASACRGREEPVSTKASPPAGASVSGAPAARPVRWPDRPDVVLVTIDTLRADAVGYAGNTRVQTPALDRLAAEGEVFTEAHAQNVVTLPSHVNILTGLYPYQHGVRDNSGFRVPPGTPTIATLLKARGYATGAFIGAFPLDSRFGLTEGFDLYEDRYPRGKSQLDFEMAERPATDVVASALAWWSAEAAKKPARPRFLWVHVYDCHAPYRPRPPFDEKYRDDPYLGEVAATDDALAPLFNAVTDAKSSRPAVIVVTSDHGEARGDHGEETHGLFAYEATLHVPLLVWARGIVPAGRRTDAVRHVDVAPTILDAAGVPKPAAWPGATLFPASPAERPSYFESYSTAFNRGWAPLRGVVADGRKYVDLPIPELYDLARDPKEDKNLAGTDADEVRRLARLLPPESAFAAVRRGKVTSEEAAKLRSLGYLSGGGSAKAKYTAADDPKNLVGVDQQLHQMVDLYQRGQLEEAIGVARKVVADNPSMAIGYENVGFLLRQGGRTDEALGFYAKAAAAGISDEDLTRHHALALCEAGRPAEALKVLAPLASSDDPETGNARGIALSDAGRDREAQDAFRRVLALDGKNVEALTNLGIVRLRENDARGARDFFERALAGDPAAARAWNGVGVARMRLGDEKGAVVAWQKASELDPKMFDALFNLGLVAGKNGMRREARDALERFVAGAPPSQYGADIEKARGLLRRLAEPGA